MEEEAQPAKEQRSHERNVEELAGPEDYWMTLTDSARATRRQEATIRRWVAGGELPVRRYRVGLNKAYPPGACQRSRKANSHY
jgi:hypothetical protein